MFNWMRKIPHPKYGKCGGASRDCSPSKPIDEMDEAFASHDLELFEADKLPKEKRKAARKIADENLSISLRAIDSKKLSFRGRVYRRLAMMVFNYEGQPHSPIKKT